MDLKQYKIEKYENGVSNLPDYPSSEEYTADELKAVFDSRSDVIQKKHDALIDALTTAFAPVKAHGTDASAHLELFANLRKEISADMPGKLSELSDDLGFGEVKETAEATRKEVGTLQSNLTGGSVEVKNATRATYADEASIAFCDGEGNDIYETYATKDEVNAVSGEAVIAESKAYTDDLERRLENNSIDDTYVNWAYFCDDAYTAQCDVNGNDIMETYATKDEVGTLQSNLTGGSVKVKNATRATYADEASIAFCDGEGNDIYETYATKEELKAYVENAILGGEW